MDGSKRTGKLKVTEAAATGPPDENTVLAEIGRTVNSSLELEEVFERIGDQIRVLLSSDRLAINLFDQESLELKIQYVSGLDIPDCRVGKIIQTEGSMVMSSLQSGKVMVGQGMGEDEPLERFSKMSAGMQVGIKSFMAIPLIFKEALVGTIGLQSLRPNAYSENDVLIGERVSSYVAGAIANAQLYTAQVCAENDQRRLAEENSVIAEIGRIISSSADISEVYAQFGEVVSGLLPFDRISVSIADLARGEVQTAYAWGIEIPGGQPGDVFPLDGTTTQLVFQGDTTVVCGSKGVKGPVSRRTPTEKQIEVGLQSFLAVPLRAMNETKGILQVYSKESDIYLDHHVGLLSTIADQISGAIANSQLYVARTRAEVDQKRLADENAAMADIGRIISSSADISDVYEQFGQVVGRLLRFDRISITSVDLEIGEAQTAFAWGIGLPGRKPGTIFPSDGTPIETVVCQDGAVVGGASDVHESAYHGDLSSNQIKRGIRSFIAVPLRAKNEIIGVLQVHSRESGIYLDQHVRLLGTIADQISGVVANSRLYAKVASSEERLRNSENKLRAIYESTASGVLTMDGTGVIESVNPAARRIFGYTSDELIGQNVSMLMPDSYQKNQQDSISNYFLPGKADILGVDRELVGLRKDGIEFPVEMVISAIDLDGQGSFAGIVRDITQRVKAQEEMQRLATIVGSVNDPIFAIDTDKRVTVWNRAAEKLYGYSPEEILGGTIDILSLPGLKAKQAANAELGLSGQLIPTFDTQKITKSGEIIEISSSGAPIFDENGAVTGVVGVHRDITDRKQSEEEVQRLATIVESVNDAIIAIDTNQKITVWNAAAEKFYGYSAEEALGKPHDLVTPPHELAALAEVNLVVQKGDRLASFDTQRVSKSGEIIDISASGSPIFDRDGAVVGVVGVHRDISGRKKAEEEVQRLATIVESVDDPIIAIDPEMRVTVWNGAAQRLYGYSREEVLGRDIEFLSLPHLRPLQLASVRSVLSGQLVRPYETQKVTKTGEIIEVTSSGSPIFDQQGVLIGLVGLHRDITALKQAERTLRETEERFNAQLLEEKNRAEETQVSKTQQLQTIFEIAEILAGPADFQTKANAVSAIILEKLEADAVALRMLNEDTNSLDVVAIGGLRFAGLPDSMSLDVEGFSQRAFREGKSVSIGDYSKIPDAIPGAIKRGLKSICSIGLRGADGPNGLLNIASRQSDHFNEERLELLEAVAGGIAAMFESARLAEDLQRSRKEIEVTGEVARIITSTLDIEGGYGDFFDEMKKLINFDYAGVVMANEDSQEAAIVYSTFPTKLPYSVGETFPLPGTLLGRVMELRRGIIIPDMTEKSDHKASEQLVKHGLLSILVSPLIFEDKIIGGFALCSAEKNNFGNRERVILDRLASLVAPSVRNAMLYQEADQSAIALDSIGEAVAFLNVDAEIRHVNRTFEETFGYTADELRGRSVSIITENSSVIDEQGQEILEQGILDGWSGEVVRRTKSGELLNILLTVTPVKDKTGKVIGRISVSRDITERKKTEGYLNEQNRLAALGQLAAGIAHEINNPLANILLCSQLLAESDISEDSMTDLNIISDAAQRAARIVRGLLLFARREDPEPEPMALDLIVHQALELKKYDFRTNDINLVLEFEADLPNSLVDEHQMSQVILNILNNAEHALKGHKNGGVITIRTSFSAESVLLEIRDDGPGIEPELLSRIFEPFFTTKKAGEGTGLGLSICHGIVQQHQGDMWVTSEVGLGASFFVRLPVSHGVGVAHHPHPENNEPGGAP